MNDFRKCDKNGCCKFLMDRITGNGIAGGQGFHSINTVNLNDKVGQAKATFRGVAYKTSSKDRALMVNFCPFCGGRPGSARLKKG